MFLVALPRSSKQSAFLLFFCDLSKTWQKFTRTKISEMKPVISICPCGVAIQYIAEKTRRGGSRSKTVTGNTLHCSMRYPTFKDWLLSACQNFRPQKTPPQTGYHLRSKQLLVFRSNCKTSVPNILKKKNWFNTRTGPWSCPKPEVDTVPGLGVLKSIEVYCVNASLAVQWW